MFFYVYTLKSKLNEKLYIGLTRNLGRRAKEHNLKLKNAKRSKNYRKTNKGRRLLKRRVNRLRLLSLRFA